MSTGRSALPEGFDPSWLGSNSLALSSEQGPLNDSLVCNAKTNPFDMVNQPAKHLRGHR